jgi:hypothetical protein
MAYPPITTLPAAPSRNDPDNFSTEADAFVAALPALVTETNAAGVYTADQATAAAADAVLTAADVVTTAADVISAAASAAAAVVTSNAALWVSEASYAEGANAISLVDFGTYRSITTHTGVATDPSADATNWTLISARPITTASTAPSYQDAVVVLTGTTPAVDLSAAGEYRLTITGNTTFTVSNPPPDDFTTTKTLRFTQGATAYTLTFWAGIEFVGGEVPASPAISETKEYTLRASTVSGTTTYVLTDTGVVS